MRGCPSTAGTETGLLATGAPLALPRAAHSPPCRVTRPPAAQTRAQCAQRARARWRRRPPRTRARARAPPTRRGTAAARACAAAQSALRLDVRGRASARRALAHPGVATGTHTPGRAPRQQAVGVQAAVPVFPHDACARARVARAPRGLSRTPTAGGARARGARRRRGGGARRRRAPSGCDPSTRVRSHGGMRGSTCAW